MSKDFQNKGTPEIDSSKMSEEKKTSTAEDSFKTETPDGSFEAKESTQSGGVLKQQKIADAITGAGSENVGISGMGINAAGANGVSGTTESISSNLGRTTTGANTRENRNGRFDKKLDRIGTKLNYTPNDRFKINFKESKPLAENGDKTVGFNGTYRTDMYVDTKMAGKVPMSREYSRTLDFIERDMTYFTQGQTIKGLDDPYNDGMPVKKAIQDENGNWKWVDETNVLKTSNYLHSALHVQYDSKGKIIRFFFDTTELPVAGIQNGTLDASAQNYYSSINQSELDRLAMDAKAGDETKTGWSPIPRAIPNGERFILYAKDIEAMAGAEVYTAYHKLINSIAFEYNKATKDGQQLKRPVKEWLQGSFKTSNSSDAFEIQDETDFTNEIFNVNDYLKGSPAIFIDAFDSKAKYNNKDDFLMQPRSFRMHIPTLRNCVNTFKVDPRFVSTFVNRECYSTFDGSYDGVKPILMTDKATLIHRHNFNDYFKVNATMDFKFGETSSTQGSGDNVTYAFTFKDEDKRGCGLFVSDKSGKFSVSESDSAITISVAHGTDISGVKVRFATHGETIQGYTEVSNSDVHWEKYPIKITGRQLKLKYEFDYTPIRKSLAVYYYFSRNNVYYTKVYNYFLEGIYNTLNNKMNTKISHLLGTNEWKIPVIHSTVGLSTWDLLIAVSADSMLENRQRGFIDFIDYEKEFGTPYSGLISMKDALAMRFKNYSYSDIDHPLVLGTLTPEEADSWAIPELIWRLPDVNSIGYEDKGYAEGHSWSTDTKDIYTFVATDYGKNLFYKVTAATGSSAPTLEVEKDSKAIKVEVEESASTETNIQAYNIEFLISELEEISGYTLYGVIPAKSTKIYVKGNYQFNNLTAASQCFMLPIYENEANYFQVDGVPYKDDDEFNTSYPNMRPGITSEIFNRIFTYDEKQYRLNLDRVTDFVDGIRNKIFKLGGYKYSAIDDGLVIVQLKPNSKFTVKDYLCLPRELGWSFVSPGRVATPKPSVGRYEYIGIDTFDHNVVGSTSYRIKAYGNIHYVDNMSLLDKTELSNARADLYKQNWIMFHNITDYSNDICNKGVLFSLSQKYDANNQLVKDVSNFIPFTELNKNTLLYNDWNFSVMNDAALLYNVINIVPFLINPFDAANIYTGAPTGIDPMYLLHMYGLCGFRASDYREDLYNKQNEIDQLDRKYIYDPWFIESRFNK